MKLNRGERGTCQTDSEMEQFPAGKRSPCTFAQNHKYANLLNIANTSDQLHFVVMN